MTNRNYNSNRKNEVILETLSPKNFGPATQRGSSLKQYAP